MNIYKDIINETVDKLKLYILKVSFKNKNKSVCLIGISNVTVFFTKKMRDQGNVRSSHPEVFCKKGAVEKFAKFTGKHLR